VAVRGERIAAVGSNADVTKLAGPETVVLDAAGRLVVPGFIDAHVHFSGGAQRRAEVDLTGVCTLEAIQARIAAWAKAHPDAPWITGGGWEYSCFPGSRLPTREDLDAAVRDRPAILSAYDGHTSWANSKALEVAGITRQTEYKAFGELVKDPRTGEPTGCFKEGAASLVRRVVPRSTPAQRLAAVAGALPYAASLGITSIENASGDASEIALYEELLRQGRLTLRVSIAMSAAHNAQPCAAWRDIKGRHDGPMLRVAAAKFLIDGVIESHTAAMLQPYADGDQSLGQLSWNVDDYRSAVKSCHDEGWQVWTHSIGDRGVRLALDAYEQLPPTARARVEHIETVQPGDIPRFAKLGVIASMMPIHADPATVDVWSRAVGPARIRYSFAWRSLEQSGAKLAFSSDWPASISVDPIRGIHNAVNRRTVDGKPPGGWIPEERVSVESALRAYTIGAAYAGFEEKVKGSIEPGKLADMLILTEDLFRIPPQRIHQARVAVTVFNGRKL
jgi:hypothetical protein